MPAWRSAITSPWTALTSQPTRRATSRIDNAPWAVIALRISQRFLVRVFQSRSTESNEMRAPCSSPRNAAAARRETSSRGAIARVTYESRSPLIDVAPEIGRQFAHSPRENVAFRGEVNQRYFVQRVIVRPLPA